MELKVMILFLVMMFTHAISLWWCRDAWEDGEEDMEFYRVHDVVVVAEQSAGNETVGSMWLETGVVS